MKNYRLIEISMSENYLTIARDLILALAGQTSWKIIQALIDAGYHPMLVGGTVRDLLMNRDSHDIDIEVHGCTLQQLEQELQKFGTVLTVGKVYGILRLAGTDVDWSVPRADTAGRHPQVRFDVTDIKQAFIRRDLTINAMGIDLQTGELIDPFNGLQDIRERRLNVPDPDFFIQDPLRFYRVVRFMGTLQMTPSEQLSNLCSMMDLSGIARERIYSEIYRFLSESDNIDVVITWLYSINRVDALVPDLQQQSVRDLQELTASLDYPPIRDLPVLERFLARAAILVAAVPLAIQTKAMQALTGTIDQRTMMNKIVRSIEKPLPELNNPIVCKHLALATNPVSLTTVLPTIAAWHHCAQKELHEWIVTAHKSGVLYEPEAPLLTGADLMPFVEPGPEMGRLLNLAYERQLSGVQNKEALLESIQEILAK